MATPVRLRDCVIGERVFKLPIMVWVRLQHYTSGEDIIASGYRELLKIENIGRKKLLIIRDALKEHGLSLDIPAEYEPKMSTEREQRLKSIRKFNAELRRRSKARLTDVMLAKGGGR